MLYICGIAYLLNFLAMPYNIIRMGAITLFNNQKSHFEIKLNQGYYEFAQDTPDYTLITNPGNGQITTAGVFYSYGNNFENLGNRAIYTNNGEITPTLIVEECQFNNINSADKGGAIFFECKGTFSYNRVCSIQCSSSESCNHIYAQGAKIKQSESTFLNNRAIGRIATYLRGVIGLTACNYTNIKATEHPSFVLQNVNSEVSIINSVTLYNLESDKCILQCQDKTRFSMSSCNFFNNKYGNNGFQVTNTEIALTRCSIFGNKDKNYAIKREFFSIDSSSTISIKQSFYDGTISTRDATQQPENEKFLNLFQPLSLGKCKAKKLNEMFDINCAKYDEVSGREQMIKLIFSFMAQNR